MYNIVTSVFDSRSVFLKGLQVLGLSWQKPKNISHCVPSVNPEDHNAAVLQSSPLELSNYVQFH